VSVRHNLSLRLSNARSFFPLFGAAGAVASTGLAEWALTICMPLFVYATTGSTSQAGLVIFAILGTAFVVRFLLGPVLDRVGQRLVALVAAVVQAAVMVVILVLFGMDRLTFPVLFGLLALVGGVGGAGTLAKDKMVPTAARYVGVRESVGVGLNSAVIIGGQAVGPSLGAFLAPFPKVALLVTAGLFMVGALFVLAVPRRMEQTAVPAAHAEGKSGYWQSQGAGIKYVGKHPVLSRLAVMLFVVEFMNAPLNGVMLPLWAKQTGTAASEIPVIVTLAAIAGALGSVVAILLGERVRPWVVKSVGYTMIPVQMAALALGAPVPWVMVFWFAAGFCGSFPYLEAEKLKYGLPRPEFQTRSMSVIGSFQRSGSALGPVLLAVAVGYFGLTALLPCAVVFIIVTQGTVLSKRFRALPPGAGGNHPPEEERVGALVKEPVG